jgi:hypothetical protein
MNPDPERPKRHWFGGLLCLVGGALMASSAAAATPVGSEFQVNTFTTSRQQPVLLAAGLATLWSLARWRARAMRI